MYTLSRGERFKDARRVHNQHGTQTMQQVCLATGVSKRALSDLENDESTTGVSYLSVIALARHYGVTTDWLLGLEASPRRR